MPLSVGLQCAPSGVDSQRHLFSPVQWVHAEKEEVEQQEEGEGFQAAPYSGRRFIPKDQWGGIPIKE